MATFAGFLGPSYTTRSVNVATDRTFNLYPEVQTIPGGKTQVALYGRCGLEPWLDLGGGAVRGLFTQDDAAAAVVDDGLFALAANRAGTRIGTMANDGGPVTFSSNGTAGNQWFLTSAQHGYIYNPIAQTLTAVDLRPTTMGFFVDGYFGSLIANSNSFQICDLENGTNWSTGSAGTATRSESSDNLVACVVDHRYIWALGSRTTLVYYNAGTTFPFAPLPSIFVETGCGAAFSPTQLDNGLCWIGQSYRGARTAMRTDGPTPAPTIISTKGVEWIWNGYDRIDDAIGWAVEWQGHSFWYLYFPSADATWVYDASQPPQYAWHEEGRWDAAAGVYHAYPGRCHAYAFGEHLIGSNHNGVIYRMTPDSFSDDDVPIRWFRRTNHICQEQMRQIHDRFQVDLEVGVGLSNTGLQGSAPQCWLRWSDDGGHQWSSEYAMSMGALGQYKYRAFLTRLGLTRDRVYELAGSDPVKTALIAAYLNVRGGTS